MGEGHGTGDLDGEQGGQGGGLKCAGIGAAGDDQRATGLYPARQGLLLRRQERSGRHGAEEEQIHDLVADGAVRRQLWLDIDDLYLSRTRTWSRIAGRRGGGAR